MKPRLAVIEMHHLGDAIVALPFLRSASRDFDTLVFARNGPAELLKEALPGVQVVPSANWSAVRQASRGLGPADVAVCAWPDTRAHLAMRDSGAGRRIGFRVTRENFYGVARPWRKRRLVAGQLAERLLSPFGPLLTTALDRRTPQQNHAENWNQIGAAIGLHLDYSIPWLPLPPLPSGWRQFLSASRAAGRQTIALHPGGRRPGKRWPVDKFQELLKGYLAGSNIAVAIIAPPGETVPEPVNQWQQIFSAESIPQLAALFSEMDGVLCNDSMASHLAAAAGAPVATIFGSGDPAWFAPHANGHLVIAADSCPFRPCVDRCVQTDFVCLKSVSLHLVEEKLSAMLRGPSKIPKF